MKNRTTPQHVQVLTGNQIFVFGSNESGIHGAGAAKVAMDLGAEWGNPEGIQGNTYAIPSKDMEIRNTLSIDEIRVYVDRFIEYAKYKQQLVFLVTEICCGLAGLEPEDVAPLFKGAIEYDNIHLPSRFWDVLTNND